MDSDLIAGSIVVSFFARCLATAFEDLVPEVLSEFDEREAYRILPSIRSLCGSGVPKKNFIRLQLLAKYNSPGDESHLPLSSAAVGIRMLGKAAAQRREHLLGDARNSARRGLYMLHGVGQELRTVHSEEADPWLLLETEEKQRRLSTYPLGVFDLTADRSQVRGRITSIRRHSQVMFVDLTYNNKSIQLLFDGRHNTHRDVLQVGDSLLAAGRQTTSGTGASVFEVSDVLALVPRRSAQPYDRILHNSLSAQSKILRSLRETLTHAQFAEQMTEMLSPSYQGGRATPFAVWEEYRHRTSYLRVSSELNLLRSLAGGLDRCYEVGYSFRNGAKGGLQHSEFLLLEAYATDMSLDEMTAKTLDMITSALEPRKLKTESMTCRAAVRDVLDVDVEDETALRDAAAAKGVVGAVTSTHDALLQRLLDQVVAPAWPDILVLSEIPLPSSPLTAGSRQSAQRRWVYCEGLECAEVAANEMVPEIIRSRLDQQFRADPNAVLRDYRMFIDALQSGIPAVVGVGLGVSRLLAVQTGSENFVPPLV